MATAVRTPSSYRRLALGVGLALGLFVLLFVVLDHRALVRSLADADPAMVGLAAAAALCSQLCWSLTTTTILGGVDETIPRRRVQLGYLAGTFGRQVLPLGNVAGSAILSYIISEDLGRRFRDVFAPVTASELLVFAGSVGVAVLGLVAMLASPYAGVPAWLVLALLTTTVLLIVGTGAVVAYRFHYVAALVTTVAGMIRGTVGRVSVRVERSLAPKRVETGIETFLDGFGAATDETGRLALAATLSVAGWVAFSLALLLGCRAVGVEVPLGVALFLTPASGVVMFLPTPGGLGSTEVGLTAAIAVLVTVPPELAAAGVLIYRLATYWFLVTLGGLASLYLSATVWHALD